jgi:hypothetical protein
VNYAGKSKDTVTHNKAVRSQSSRHASIHNQIHTTNVLAEPATQEHSGIVGLAARPGIMQGPAKR